MQKKIIALAVAGLVSAPAFAQSNVTVYGVMGTYFQNTKTEATTTATGAMASASVNTLNTDGESGSRIGFRGTEDLGGGLKANFTIETGVEADTGTQDVASGANGLGNRQIHVGLSGNWGSFSMGRQYSAEFYHMAAKSDIWGYADWSALLAAGMAADTRINNSWQYASPSMGGFSGRVTFGLSEQAASPKQAGETMGLNLDYANGPMWVGFGWMKKNVDSNAVTATVSQCINNTTGAITTTAAGTACGAGTTALVAGTAAAAAVSGDNTWTSLGASYDFGMGKVSGNFANRKAGATGVKTTQWQLGANFKVGGMGAVIAQYASSNQAGAADTDVRAWAIGYQHTMSKRTNLVVGIANTDQSGSAATITDTRKVYGGVRHTF